MVDEDHGQAKTVLIKNEAAFLKTSIGKGKQIIDKQAPLNCRYTIKQVQSNRWEIYMMEGVSTTWVVYSYVWEGGGWKLFQISI